MATIGKVVRQKDGSYAGALKTLSIRAKIEIRPVKKKVPNGPDFEITSEGVEVGAAWTRKGQRSNKEYVSCMFSAPEFGAKPLYANLGHQAGSADPNEFALIWNTQQDEKVA
jgi:uncharacterized protein (DUF736 family)